MFATDVSLSRREMMKLGMGLDRGHNATFNIFAACSSAWGVRRRVCLTRFGAWKKSSIC
jgi:hypothetical protein